MYRSILVFVFFVISFQLTAQLKIVGQLTEANSQVPLAGVSVYLADMKLGMVTDFEGRFQFSQLRSGAYILEAGGMGYESKIVRILLNRDTIINLTLIPAVKELGELIVTGVGRSTDGKYNPVAIKAIDASALNQNGATNLIDGLKQIPGVDQITSGTAISKPVIRGLGYNRVITLNNGLRQEGQQWGDEHGIEMDEYGVGRVEIIKGPGSLMYGSDGIAGVLNFIAPKMPVSGSNRTQVVSNFQSNNRMIGSSIDHAENKKGIVWQTRITNKLCGNYQNKLDGKVFNSGFKELDGNVMLGVNRNWGHSYFTLSGFSQVVNLPEGERDSSGKFVFTNVNGNIQTANSSDYKGYRTGIPHQDIQHVSLASNHYWMLKHGSFNADVGYSVNNRKEFGNPMIPNDIDLFFSLRTAQYLFRYNLGQVKGWELTLGSGGMQQQNFNKGLVFLIPQYNLLDAGIFAYTSKTKGRWSIAGGLRFDHRFIATQSLYLDSLGMPTTSANAQSKLKFGSISKSYLGFSGSFGVALEVNENATLKCNISRGYRSPNIAELSSNGRHEGTFRYELGNPDLQPEISHQLDVAYLLNSEHVSLEISPFINHIDHFIFSAKLPQNAALDSTIGTSENVAFFHFVSGKATLLGGEIYTDVHPHPWDWLHIENSFSMVQGMLHNQTDSTRYLPFIPAPKYRGELKAQWKTRRSNIFNGYVKISVDHFFEQSRIFNAYGTETITPAYSLLGAGANIKGLGRSDFLSIYVSGENLTNVVYQSHLSRLKYAPVNMATGQMGIFNMGRNISVKMIMTL